MKIRIPFWNFQLMLLFFKKSPPWRKMFTDFKICALNKILSLHMPILCSYHDCIIAYTQNGVTACEPLIHNSS
jgi:hypothetical protein